MTAEIDDWMTAQTFHPRLTIDSASPDAVVSAIRHELELEGYKVKEAIPTRTRLLHRDWLAIASGVWARTEVALSPGDGTVLVEVTHGAENRSGRTKGRRALNAAVSSLTRQGTAVTVGPWHKAP